MWPCVEESKIFQTNEKRSSLYKTWTGTKTIPKKLYLLCCAVLCCYSADAAVFGDANLTFSMKLARHRKALGHVGRVIATTFEDLPTLRERYKDCLQTGPCPARSLPDCYLMQGDTPLNDLAKGLIKGNNSIN